jgi:hypothetical protein
MRRWSPLLLAGLLATCQSPPPPPDDTVPVEEAKKHKIIYRAPDATSAYTPPPRTADDIKALLAQRRGSAPDRSEARAPRGRAARDHRQSRARQILLAARSRRR